MPAYRSIEHADDAELARREASLIQRIHPRFFGDVRVDEAALARTLGFRIEERAGLQQRAQLEICTARGDTEETIIVQAELERNVRRFAIAHEIGHAVLLRMQPQAATQWAIERREAFANVFAAEVLVTPSSRTCIQVTFPSVTDPPDLLRLASQVGLSPHALLILASERGRWLEGLHKVWLRVKHVVNAFTHDEPKLRIVSAHYDSNRFFIPTNQSLVRFAGDDAWLSSVPLGANIRHNAKVTLKFRQPAPSLPKFVSKNVPADLSAMRLHASTADQVAYFIVLADLSKPTAESSSPNKASAMGFGDGRTVT